MKLPPEDEEHYRYLLDSFDATAEQIAQLPPYQHEHPELVPSPGTMPRAYWKESTNPLNAWSHRTDIKSTSSTSNELSGKTIAVKDNVSVAGVPITGGTFPELLTGKSEYPISEIDAVVVSRVLQAGATIVGTATCEHLSFTPLSYTSASGPVHNAWRRGWTSGGSSSGPGSLVGASQIKKWRKRHGLPSIDDDLGPSVDMAIGGDQGGSIRVPAAYNGIYGLKPTHGLVPYTGILSLVPMIDHTGPMCTSLEDVAMLLKVLAGYDGIDPRMTPDSPKRKEVKDYPALLKEFISGKQQQGQWTPSDAGKGLRVGIVKESFEVIGLTEPVKNIVKGAIERFREIGASVEEVSIPMHLIGPSIWTIATRVGIATYGFQNHPLPVLNYPIPGINPPVFDQHAYEILTKYNPAAVNAHFTSTFLTHKREPALQAKATAKIYELRRAYDNALANYDVLITPINPTTGLMHPRSEDDVGQKAAVATGATSNTCQFNLTGRKCYHFSILPHPFADHMIDPALAMPIGFGTTSDGKAKMPIAMQIVGRRFDDEMVLKAALAWEVPGKGIDSWDGKEL